MMIEVSFPHSITKEEISKLPLKQFDGETHVISSPSEVEAAYEKLKNESILGFDTETRPAFKKGIRYPVALLQLASENAAYLFRLNYINFPEPLRQILTDQNIIKVGVAIHDDVKQLQDRSPFIPRGFLDLSDVARKLKIRTSGLRSLTGIFLEGRISKKLQVSNWACRSLSPAQVTYAATDAWISREIYLYLKNNYLLPEMDSNSE